MSPNASRSTRLCRAMVAVGPACALARGLSGASPSRSTQPPSGRRRSAAGSRPASRHAASISADGGAAVGDVAGRVDRARAELGREPARLAGPCAATCSGIGSVTLMTPSSGLRKRIFRRFPSKVHSSVSPASRPRTTRTYSSMSASFTGPRPIVRRAVKPVPMPKSMRPGASAFRRASAARRHWRDAVRRDQHAGGEPDPRRSASPRARHGDEQRRR